MNTKQEKPDCYKCAHRRELPGNAHSRCNKFDAAAVACERADLDPVECIKIEVSPCVVSYEDGPGGRLRFSQGVTVY